MRKPSVPNGPGAEHERPPHKYNTVDRKLMRGRCPYRDKWRSGLGRKIVWPPIDAHIFEDDNICHTMCTCGACSSPGSKPAEASAHSAEAPAFAPSGSPPQDPDGFLSCDEYDDDDDPIDWLARLELVDIFAPFSDPVATDDLPASSPHSASSSTPPQMDNQALLQDYSNMLDDGGSPPLATPERQEFLQDDFPKTALAPPAKPKKPAFVMGKRGRGMTPQN